MQPTKFIQILFACHIKILAYFNNIFIISMHKIVFYTL